MRRLVIAAFALLLSCTPVGAWWTPYHTLKPITAFRFERVEPNASPQGFFDGAWQAAFPAKSQTCETAARDLLVKAKRDGWDVDAQPVIDGTVAFITTAGEHAPCYAALFVR